MGRYKKSPALAGNTGRAINKDILPNQRPIDQRVIVLMHADGHVELYGTAGVLGIVINRPVATDPESSIGTDELIENVLPFPYRGILAPGNLISSAKLDKFTPERLSDIVFKARVHHSIKPTRATVNSVIYTALGGMSPHRAIMEVTR